MHRDILQILSLSTEPLDRLIQVACSFVDTENNKTLQSICTKMIKFVQDQLLDLGRKMEPMVLASAWIAYETHHCKKMDKKRMISSANKVGVYFSTGQSRYREIRASFKTIWSNFPSWASTGRKFSEIVFIDILQFYSEIDVVVHPPSFQKSVEIRNKRLQQIHHIRLHGPKNQEENLIYQLIQKNQSIDLISSCSTANCLRNLLESLVQCNVSSSEHLSDSDLNSQELKLYLF
jgi:hypothetical protein